MKQKIRYEDLSTHLKVGIITSYVLLSLYLLLIIIGIIKGLIGLE